MNFRELRHLSGMTRKDFAEYFEISIRTIENWEYGRHKCPDYLIDLMLYKLRKEGIIKWKY